MRGIGPTASSCHSMPDAYGCFYGRHAVLNPQRLTEQLIAPIAVFEPMCRRDTAKQPSTDFGAVSWTRAAPWRSPAPPFSQPLAYAAVFITSGMKRPMCDC